MGKGLKDPLIYIILLASLGSLGENMYVPALLSIAESLNFPLINSKLTISIYIIAFSMSQLLFGPLSDHIGRKKTILIGLSCYLVGAIISLLSLGFNSLLLGRFLQGMGGSVGSTLARTLIKDLFRPDDQRRIFSIILSVIPIATLLGPFLGGLITQYAQWRFIFVFLAIYCIVLIYVTLKNINVELVVERRLNILKVASIIITYPQFMINLLMGGFLLSMIFSYSMESPFIFIKLFGLNPAGYGLLGVATGGIYLTGSLISSKFGTRYSPEWLITLGLIIACCGSIVMLILPQIISPSLLLFIVLVIVILFGVSLAKSNTSAAALLPLKEYLGTSSAILGFSQMLIAGLITLLLRIFPANNYYALSICFSSLSMAALLLMIFCWYRNLFKMTS